MLLEPTGAPFRDAVLGTNPARAWGVADVPLVYDPPVTDPAVDLKRAVRPASRADRVECILQADGTDEKNATAPRRLVHLADKDILLVTSESGYHAVYDYCTVAYLRQAGCEKTTHLERGTGSGRVDVRR